MHHVREWADGGPTHTSNGVSLCWHHHRTLDTSGWAIRMRHGTPEIRGPHWWDPYHAWRRPRHHGAARPAAETLAGALGPPGP
ncbi:HNH endonuclease signature motif containing protein [Microbacterium panaciterrae]|uniref:HNH endonuclease signature motif containing protein n=1 Tax=Microbacterium panaciterrae TaxID=985759 RepID=UPI0031EFD80A